MNKKIKMSKPIYWKGSFQVRQVEGSSAACCGKKEISKRMKSIEARELVDRLATCTFPIGEGVSVKPILTKKVDMNFSIGVFLNGILIEVTKQHNKYLTDTIKIGHGVYKRKRKHYHLWKDLISG